jgi:hypothetical protein
LPQSAAAQVLGFAKALWRVEGLRLAQVVVGALPLADECRRMRLLPG